MENQDTKRPSALVVELFELADEFVEFASEFTEALNFEDYDNVNAWETKLVAFANMLFTSDREGLASDEIASAREFLSWLRSRANAE